MNPYALERLARQRTDEVQATRATTALRPPATNMRIRNVTGWALIQIGLALVTSARGQATEVRPDLP
jgi:hypothetical protein